MAGVLAVVSLALALLAGCGPGSPAPPPPSSVPPAGGTGPGNRPEPSSLSSYVDPFTGTGVGGASVGAIDTFPGADMPFGMVQWSPDTSPDRPAGGGYAYQDSAISGFSLTHLSGPGCTIDGDVPILPTEGALGSVPDLTTEPFSHRTEVAHPGSYAVTVGHPGVRVELAVTTRAGLGRFTFAGSAERHVLFKVADSANGSSASAISIVGDDEVDGSVTSGEFCDTGGEYQVYFAARFDSPFSSFGTWSSSGVVPGSRSSTKAQSGGYVTFGPATAALEMQVGLSYVSVAGAEANLAAEAPGWDLDALEQRDTATWNEILGRIDVSGGTVAEEQTFYSDLYHSLLDPSVFDDDDGQYMGFDGKVHVAVGYTQYTNFSEWDIYRDEVPLLALVAPGQTSDMVASLLADAAQGGALPKWVQAASDAAQQNGDSADPIIASAYAFGARGFDAAEALTDMVRGATDPSASNGTYPERQNLSAYLAKGYVAATTLDLTSLDYTVGGSETLEYAIDDFAISQMAQYLGDSPVAGTFIARAQNWRNLVDPAVGYLEARGADGKFPSGPAFQPAPEADVGQVGWEEGNAIQYTWSVPQNLHGLFEALGGNAAVVRKLDTFFTKLNTSRRQPYDWAGNEPSLGIPWEYDYAGAPWRTQSVVRRIETSLYGATPDGEPGNDDLGALSSWYVWAAIGMYPEVPGRAELVLGSPLFPHVTLTLGDGNAIVIDAPAASAATPYVRAMSVSGLAPGSDPCVPGPASSTSTSATSAPVTAPAYGCPWLPASVAQTGARIDVTLGTSPDTSWGSSSADAPPSFPAPAG